MMLKPCKVCGTEFLPAHKNNLCCSLACTRAARRASAAKPRRKWGKVKRTCAVCRKTFDAFRSERERQFCSRACWRVHLKDVTGEDAPGYKHGRRVGVRDVEGEARWYMALGSTCEHPLCLGVPAGMKLALHHVCYRQHVKRAGGDVWDPRNGLTLCTSCHTSHHQRGRVLPVDALTADNRAFLVELLGDSADDYLSRYYASPIAEAA